MMLFSFVVVALCSVAIVRAQSSFGYCSANLLVPAPVDAQGKRLVHVSVLHRHGARVPHVADPLPDVAPKVNWTCGLSSLGVVNGGEQQPGRLFRKHFDANENVLAGNCQLGQLLDAGGKQHRKLGAAYRAKYVTLLRFLPRQMNASQMWLRSTDYERTLASLENNLRGLYPPSSGGVDREALRVHTRDGDSEYLHAGDNLAACPAFGPLVDAAKQTPAWRAVTANLDALGAEVRALVGDAPLSSLRDNAWCRVCSGKGKYAGLSDALFDAIDGNYTAQYYLRRGTDEMKRLAIGPFFNRVIGFMNAHVNDAPAPRWAHFSAHDSTLTAALAALAGTPHTWPPYAAHVELELWLDAADKPFVQISADGRVISAFAGALPRMAPLEDFVAHMRPLLIAEDAWRIACRTP